LHDFHKTIDIRWFTANGFDSRIIILRQDIKTLCLLKYVNFANIRMYAKHCIPAEFTVGNGRWSRAWRNDNRNGIKLMSLTALRALLDVSLFESILLARWEEVEDGRDSR
jgi:hypothetical protein